MTDWREAGRKADAHRIRDLYRGAFASDSKSIARRRVIEAMRAAGVTTVLDLWGGGVSARDLTKAGFRVISVDDGSMELTDQGLPVSRARKRRALEYTAAEDGYEARFGKAETFANEADGAYLDFCGPWTANTRRTVSACRHMKAVAVTLTPDHDVSTDASIALERQMAYQLFLKMAWSTSPRWSFLKAAGNVRRLLDYRRSRGYAVYLYLLSPTWLKLRPLSASERQKTRPDMHERRMATKRAWYQKPDNRAKALEKSRLRTIARQQERAARVPSVCPCGKEFRREFSRRNATYCSDACPVRMDKRRAYHRARYIRTRVSGVSGTPDEAIQS